jgi:hypothetical protein
MSKYNMNKFERMLITSIYKRDTRIEIFEENEYKLQVKKYDKKWFLHDLQFRCMRLLNARHAMPSSTSSVAMNH